MVSKNITCSCFHTCPHVNQIQFQCSSTEGWFCCYKPVPCLIPAWLLALCVWQHIAYLCKQSLMKLCKTFHWLELTFIRKVHKSSQTCINTKPRNWLTCDTQPHMHATQCETPYSIPYDKMRCLYVQKRYGPDVCVYIEPDVNSNQMFKLTTNNKAVINNLTPSPSLTVKKHRRSPTTAGTQVSQGSSFCYCECCTLHVYAHGATRGRTWYWRNILQQECMSRFGVVN